MNTSSSFTAPPLAFAFMGHAFTGAVKAVVVAVLLWSAHAAGVAPLFDLLTAVVTAIVVMAAVEMTMTLIERGFVLKHRHPDPGSVPLTVISVLVPPVIAAVVGFAMHQTVPAACWVAAVTALVCWACTAFLERPWVEGDTQEDIRAKYEATKSMTREHFQ